jgi:hypothetical protein
MDEAEFLQWVHEHIAACTSAGALGLAGYAWTQGADDQTAIFALDLEPPQAWATFMAEASKPEVRRGAFALDRYGRPHQGTTLGDLVAGIYVDKTGDPSWRISPFVVEYTAKPEPRVLWFNWANEFWNAAIRLEMASVLNTVRTGGDFSGFRNVTIDPGGRMRDLEPGPSKETS